MPEQSLDINALPFLKQHLIPAKYTFKCFSGQLPDERAFLLIERHWIIDLMLLVRLIFWMVLPTGLYSLAREFLPDMLGGDYEGVARVVLLMLMLFVWLRYYIHWLDERLDFVVLTDRRIVDINQNGLFNRQTSEASLAQIQDVRTEVSGLIATLIRYGEIEVQTAGDNANIRMTYISHPTTVANQILKIRDEYLQGRRAEGSVEVEMSSDV